MPIKKIYVKKGEYRPKGSYGYYYNANDYTLADANAWAEAKINGGITKAQLQKVGTEVARRAEFDYLCLIWADEPEFNEWGEVCP